MNELLNMDLHEELTPSTEFPVAVLRVPGGWIYTLFLENTITSTFVPFTPDQLLSDRELG